MKNYSLDNINLPKVNLNEDLETISNNIFRPLFDVNKFEIRSETVRDKGIDFHIEIKKEQSTGESVYTNFRFAVQLKATDSIEANIDGSFSLQIYSSNINYLLNNGMPAFYVFYHKPTNSFYYESVNNFFVELQKKNVNWDKQEKHTLRFSKLFDNDALLEIYQETFNNGLLFRQLNQHLKFVISDSKSSGIVIDKDKEIYSIAENIAYIDQFGQELINGHHFNFIIEIEQRSHPRTEATPRFNLICGIAYFQHGNLYKAMELLKLAQQKSDNFELNVQAMLTYTLLNAKFLLGIMSKDEFEQEMSKITENENSGAFFEIEKAYNEISSNKVKPSEGLKILYATISDIIKKNEQNISTRIVAYSKILEAEAVILFHDLELNFSYFMGRVNEPLKTKVYLEWLEIEKAYLKRMDALIEFALKNKDFLGVTNLTSAKISWNYKKIFHSHILKNWGKDGFDVNSVLSCEDLDILTQDCDKLDKLASTYEMLEHRENMISCLNNKYEILIFIEQKEEAEITKGKILGIIETNDFVGLKARHNDMVNGKNPHDKFLKNYTSRINGIKDLAIKCGVDFYSDFSEDLLLDRKAEWSIDNFLEFKFPKKIDSIKG
ncbi:MAG: DUF4365 domain-containing protein [Flavobacteriales bacterium]|nr:DUF4365 domain-containing protein [Flavobacteriales bacterium]